MPSSRPVRRFNRWLASSALNATRVRRALRTSAYPKTGVFSPHELIMSSAVELRATSSIASESLLSGDLIPGERASLAVPIGLSPNHSGKPTYPLEACSDRALTSSTATPPAPFQYVRLARSFDNAGASMLATGPDGAQNGPPNKTLAEKSKTKLGSPTIASCQRRAQPLLVNEVSDADRALYDAHRRTPRRQG